MQGLIKFLEEAKATFQKMSPVELDIEVTKDQTKQVMEFNVNMNWKTL